MASVRSGGPGLGFLATTRADGVAYPDSENDESFYCSGSAVELRDASVRAAVETAVVHNVRSDEVLFELSIERVLHTTWLKPRQPDTEPVYERWRDPA